MLSGPISGVSIILIMQLKILIITQYFWPETFKWFSNKWNEVHLSEDFPAGMSSTARKYFKLFLLGS